MRTIRYEVLVLAEDSNEIKNDDRYDDHLHVSCLVFFQLPFSACRRVCIRRLINWLRTTCEIVQYQFSCFLSRWNRELCNERQCVTVTYVSTSVIDLRKRLQNNKFLGSRRS